MPRLNFLDIEKVGAGSDCFVFSFFVFSSPALIPLCTLATVVSVNDMIKRISKYNERSKHVDKIIDSFPNISLYCFQQRGIFYS